MFNRMRHFLAREIYPRLGLALARFEPTQEEIDAALRECRERDLLIGKKLNSERVHAAVEEARLADLRVT
jgi:hypothetical protein